MTAARASSKPFAAGGDRALGAARLRMLRAWFAPEAPKVRLLAALGLGRAAAEAAALLALAPLITAIGAGDPVALRLGGGAPALLGQPAPIEISTALLLALCALALGLRFAVHAAAALVTGRVVASYETRLRARAHRSFLQMSWRAQAEQSVGRLQSSINVSITASARAIVAASRCLASAAAATVLLVCAAAVHVGATAFVVGLGALIFAAMRPMSGAAARRVQEQAELSARFGDQAAETVALARDFRVYHVIEPVTAQFERDATRYGALARSVWMLRELTPALYQFLASLGVLGALVGLYLSGGGAILPIIAVVLLAVRAFSYGQVAQNAYHVVSELAPYVEDIRTTLARYESQPARFGSRPLPAFERLTFEDVRYAPAPGVVGLRGVSFEIRRGESVGVVGPSGAGKSTLLSLALGLTTPDLGRVVVNGAALADHAAADWFGLIGFVPQEPQLFRGRMRDNIRFHRAALSDSDIDEAAERAGLGPDVRATAEGLDRDVGEGGSRLSGGQRQRLVIARALAGRPALLVMDEPTSALDFEADAVIQTALRAVKGEIAVLVAAHRAATLAECDRVLTLEAGRLVETAAPGAGAYLRRAAAAQSVGEGAG